MKQTWALVVVWAAVLAGTGWLAWKAVGVLTDDDPPGAREPASCAEAMHFADRPGLPSGAHDATCEATRSRDTSYDVEFRIDRADFDTWLTATYPGTALSPDSCRPGTVGACAHVELKPPAIGGATAVDITVRYEAGGKTALVHFQPFDV
ncbi:hypothetical protein ACFXD5_23045 [Streptomyces sp. NPDC059385]|uniref:hypothetical protein n=1 Tax=Streptomyces sp. NPDC059385 TaxID=3346817 RepID=UPI00369DAE08